MCILLHTRHCASFVQKRDVGIAFLLSPPETRRMRDAPALVWFTRVMDARVTGGGINQLGFCRDRL